MADNRCDLCGARMLRRYTDTDVPYYECSDPNCLLNRLDTLHVDPFPRMRKKGPRLDPDYDSSPYGRQGDHLSRDRHTRTSFMTDPDYGPDRGRDRGRDQDRYREPLRHSSRSRNRDGRGQSRHRHTNRMRAPSPPFSHGSLIDDFFRDGRARARDAGGCQGSGRQARPFDDGARGGDPFADDAFKRSRDRMRSYVDREMDDIDRIAQEIRERFMGSSPPFGRTAPETPAGSFRYIPDPFKQRRPTAPDEASGFRYVHDPFGGHPVGPRVSRSRTADFNGSYRPRRPVVVEIEISEHDGKNTWKDKPAPFVYVQTEGPDGEIIHRGRKEREPGERQRHDANRPKWR